ncbi:MAG: hypothetical protein WD073_07840 [Xanthobacteraceae bacterium]
MIDGFYPPPKPAIILPNRPEIIRPHSSANGASAKRACDPRFHVPDAAMHISMLLGGLGVTALGGKGAPAAAAATQHILIVFFAYAASSTTVTWPTGWTQLFSPTFNTNVGLEARYRVTDGTEGASIELTTSGSVKSAHQCYRIGAGLSAEGAVVNGGSGSNNPDPPNLAPSWGSAANLWLSACSYTQDGGVAVTAYPSSYTDGRDDKTSTGNGCGLGTARRALTAASENPGTFTIGSSKRWVGATVAVQPSAETPTVTALAGNNNDAGGTAHTVTLA